MSENIESAVTVRGPSSVAASEPHVVEPPMVTELPPAPPALDLVVSDLMDAMRENYRNAAVYEQLDAAKRSIVAFVNMMTMWRPPLRKIEMDVDRKELAIATRFLFQACDRRAHLPVLSCVRFTEGAIVATDLDVWLEARVEGVKELDLLIPIKVLKDYVSASTRLRVRIAQGERPGEVVMIDQLAVKCLDAKEYPTLAELEKEPVGRGTLPALAAVTGAASTDPTRINLSGVFVQYCKDVAVATDGHRLHRISIPRSRSEGDFLVGAKAIRLADSIRKALKIETYDAHFFETKHGAKERRKAVVPAGQEPARVRAEMGIFQLGQFTLTHRLVEGEYPDYQQVLPRAHGGKQEDCTHVVFVDRKRLMAKLDEAAVMLRDRCRGMKFTCTENGVEISVANPDLGEYADQIPSSGAMEGAFGVNLNYLYDALAACTESQVRIGFTDENNPIEIAEGDFLAVIMPMRL